MSSEKLQTNIKNHHGIGSLDYDIEKIVSDRKIFNDFVYTPLNEAVEKLEKRQSKTDLNLYVQKSLPGGVPETIKNKKCVFLSRDVATPNYEARRFLSLANILDNFHPVFWEYSQDKFTPNVNVSKHNLAKLTFYQGLDKQGGKKIRKMNIIDFNLWNGKKIAEIKTLWGQGLIDFHHEFLEKTCLGKSGQEALFFDASDWYVKSGGQVNIYYKYIVSLFLVHGILFENFLINDSAERRFTKEVFLPAFIEVIKETGEKPLIVSLEPTEKEGDEFWLYYPHESLEFVKEKIDLV